MIVDTKMNSKNTIEKAKNIVVSRLRDAPEFKIHQSISAQIDYMSDLVLGVSKDKSRLKDINVGVYAVREFNESDPELAEVLMKIQFMADKLERGLKV